MLEWEELFVLHGEELVCQYFLKLRADVLWEDGDFAVVEAHRMEVSRPNSFVVKSGAKLGCTLVGVRGDCNGDRIRSSLSQANGITLRVMNTIVLVSLLTPGIPWARQPSSVVYDLPQSALYFGLTKRCCISKSLPVPMLRTVLSISMGNEQRAVFAGVRLRELM